MKYINKVLAGLAFLFAAMSCAKDGVVADEGLDTFSASFDASSCVKSTLEGYSPMWLPSDRISIYDGENNCFNAVLSEPSATAEFKGKLAGKGRKYYVAVYPYSEAATFSLMSKAAYGLEMPFEQKAVKGDFDSSAAVSMAYSTDNNLRFKNLCSLIKFTVSCDGVKSVEVRANGKEFLTGKFNATYSDSPKVVVTSGESSVVLKGDFEKGATYYIVTLPAVLKEGLSVILNSEVTTFKALYQVSLERSGVVDLGSISLNPEDNKGPDSDPQPQPDPEPDPDPEPEPQPSNVTVYVKGTYWHIWMWLDAGGTNLTGTEWPGALKMGDETIDGVLYSKFELPESNPHIGEKAKCLFVADGYNPDGTKTLDSESFVISEKMFFIVDSSNKPVIH